MAIRSFRPTLILAILQLNAWAQGGMPYCVMEDPDTNAYAFCRLDAATGVLTTIAPLAGVTAFVAPDKTAFNAVSGSYHFAGLAGGVAHYYTIDVANGIVSNDVPMPQGLVGTRYHQGEQRIYALQETGNTYALVTFDPTTATVVQVGAVPNMTAYVAATSVLDEVRGRYSFVALYNGNFHLRTYAIADASLIADAPFDDPLTALAFDCQDSTIYALWEDGMDYKFEKLFTNGNHLTVSVLNGVTPGLVAGSTSMSSDGVYTYRGFDANNAFAVISIEVASGTVVHNSPTLDNAVGFEEPNWCPGVPQVVRGIGRTEELTIHPQPACDMLRIRSASPMDRITVHSLTGQRTLEIVGPIRPDREVEVDLSGTSPGYYILRTWTQDGGVNALGFVRVAGE